jgi:hypothetical protein
MAFKGFRPAAVAKLPAVTTTSPGPSFVAA